MSTAHAKTLDDFVRLKNRNALAHVIRASVNLGVIQSLASEQKTVDQLAAELNLQPEPLGRLMNALIQSELVERYGENFALTTIARLIPGKYLDFGDRYWRRLEAHVRGDQTATDRQQADLDYLQNVASEEWMLTPAALDVAQALDIGKSRRGMQVLEIGCGSAVFAATFAHLDPDSVIHLLDTPEGLTRARQTVESIGLERQATMIEVANIFDLDSVDELNDQSFDLILLAGIIHRLSETEWQTFLRRLYSFVTPNGELAMIDVFPGQEKGETQYALMDLELGLRMEHRRLPNPVKLKTSLESAGFKNVQYAHLPATPHHWGLMLAERGQLE